MNEEFSSVLIECRLVVFGEFDPGELTAALGVTPTRIQRRAMPGPGARKPARMDSWGVILPSMSSAEINAPSVQLEALLDLVEVGADRFRPFIDAHNLDAHILVTSYVTKNDQMFIPTVRLEPSVITRTARLGILVEFGYDVVSDDQIRVPLSPLWQRK